MSYGENSGIHIGLFRGPPRLSEPEIKLLFAGTISSPDQSSTGCLIYNLQLWANSLCPSEALGVTLALIWKHLPCRLPQRPGPHPPESPSVPVRFGYEKETIWKNVYGNISKNCTIATLSRWLQPLQSGHRTPSVHGLAKEGGHLERQRRARDLILHISAVISSRVKWNIV